MDITSFAIIVMSIAVILLGISIIRMHREFENLKGLLAILVSSNPELEDTLYQLAKAKKTHVVKIDTSSKEEAIRQIEEMLFHGEHDGDEDDDEDE